VESAGSDSDRNRMRAVGSGFSAACVNKETILSDHLHNLFVFYSLAYLSKSDSHKKNLELGTFPNLD